MASLIRVSSIVALVIFHSGAFCQSFDPYLVCTSERQALMNAMTAIPSNQKTAQCKSGLTKQARCCAIGDTPECHAQSQTVETGQESVLNSHAGMAQVFKAGGLALRANYAICTVQYGPNTNVCDEANSQMRKAVSDFQNLKFLLQTCLETQVKEATGEDMKEEETARILKALQKEGGQGN